MPTLPTEKIDELSESLDELDVERALNYSLADALRDAAENGVQQAHGTWVRGETVCALSATAMVARARHLID